MSRWFRHYAGMARDAKLVAAALKARQPIERVVWVWSAILESAAEIDDGGRFELDAAEVAYFLHAEADEVQRILDAMRDDRMLVAGSVVAWADYSRHNIRLPWATWATIRLGVFERDNFTCTYCGASGVKLECDHVIPLSRGGTNASENLVTACKPCNNSKGSKTAQEWRAHG